ncbi:MAG: phospholipid carrier-dependent glycosyltransferase [Candidatus Dormibacteraeota bacterium]|nr:phospholipid carrier-dependent glycosyltransferase [Candidatus Dormibacteraeota bacterium]
MKRPASGPEGGAGSVEPKPTDSETESTAPIVDGDTVVEPGSEEGLVPGVPIPLEDPDEPEGRGLLDRLRLTRLDVGLMVGFVLVALFFRFFSPIMPNFLTGDFSPPITNCVHNTPIDASGHLGTLCGLAYPYQKSSTVPGQPPQPPNGEVFDEIYFGVFGHDDLVGVTYFDPEPPVAKYVIAAGEWIYGFYRHVIRGEPGSITELGYNTLGWRLGVCVSGSLAIGFMYFLALQLWRNRWFAIAAAFFACFDGLFFVESRIGVIDIVPAALQILALGLFLVHLRARSRLDSLVTLGICGFVMGLGFAAKWTALAALGVAIVVLVGRPLLSKLGQIRIGSYDLQIADQPLPGGVSGRLYWPAFVGFMIVLPCVVYFASWIPWFLFTRGPYTFQEVGGSGGALGGWWWYEYQIWYYQSHLNATHPYASAWYTWPFLIRPVWYYFQGFPNGTSAGIVNLGNPIIWWASLPALVYCGYDAVVSRRWQPAVIVLGFFAEWLPFAKVSRILFLYHMLGGLIFMVLALAYALARLQETRVLTRRGDRWISVVTATRPAYVVGAMVVAFLFFLYFYPIWTAIPLAGNALLGGFGTGKMWLSSWS